MFFYLYPFLSKSPTGQTAHHILMAQMTRTHARVCLLALVDIAAHLGDQIAQKKSVIENCSTKRIILSNIASYSNARFLTTFSQLECIAHVGCSVCMCRVSTLPIFFQQV